jgi:tetratricopeptide (TPR) repeat protein
LRKVGAFRRCCLISFLALAHGVAASPQDSGIKVLQGSDTTPSSAASTVKTNEPLAPDPALDPVRLLMRQGKLSDAEAATRSHLQTHADSAEGHFLLGYILFQEVGAKWREAGKEQGESLLYNSGDASGSVAELRDAKARESLAEFTMGARYHVPSAFDLKIVALDYILLKDSIDADRWLTRSLQGNPRDAQAWYYLGRTKYSESQFPQAIEAFQQCLRLEPRNVQAETNVGLAYEALNQSDHAVQAFESAIAWGTESSTKDPGPFIELAHLYLDQNQPEKAVPYLVQSIGISPDISKAHEELGKAYSLLHNLPEAQSELEKAVALEPATASLRCMLGKIYRQEGLLSKAKDEFDRCVALHQPQSIDNSGTKSTSKP